MSNYEGNTFISEARITKEDARFRIDIYHDAKLQETIWVDQLELKFI